MKKTITTIIVMFLIMSFVASAQYQCALQEKKVKGLKESMKAQVCTGLPCNNPSTLGTACCQLSYFGQGPLIPLVGGCAPASPCSLAFEPLAKPWEAMEKTCTEKAESCNTLRKNVYQSCMVDCINLEFTKSSCESECNKLADDQAKTCCEGHSKTCDAEFNALLKKSETLENAARTGAAAAATAFAQSALTQGGEAAENVPKSEMKDWAGRNPNEEAFEAAMNDPKKAELVDRGDKLRELKQKVEKVGEEPNVPEFDVEKVKPVNGAESSLRAATANNLGEKVAGDLARRGVGSLASGMQGQDSNSGEDGKLSIDQANAYVPPENVDDSQTGEDDNLFNEEDVDYNPDDLFGQNRDEGIADVKTTDGATLASERVLEQIAQDSDASSRVAEVTTKTASVRERRDGNPKQTFESKKYVIPKATDYVTEGSFNEDKIKETLKNVNTVKQELTALEEYVKDQNSRYHLVNTYNQQVDTAIADRRVALWALGDSLKDVPDKTLVGLSDEKTWPVFGSKTESAEGASFVVEQRDDTSTYQFAKPEE